MKATTRTKTAIAGAIFFSLVAVVCMPLMLLLNGPFQMSNWTGVIGAIKFAVILFALPAAISGYALANWMVRSPSPVEAFLLGVAVVVLANLLAALFLPVLRGTALRGYPSAFLGSAFLFFLMNVMAFYGLPFVMGGFGAVVFRMGVERLATHEV